MKIIQYLFWIISFLLITVESVKWRSMARPRIRNGQVAHMGQFPYFASILNDGALVCGGSIITSRHILTAAHCAVFVQAGVTEAVVGSTHIQGKDGQRYPIDKLISHQYYSDPDSVDYDIGILKLAKPIEFNANVKRIRLAKRLIKNASLLVCGFGKLGNGESPDQLQYTKLPSIDSTDCESPEGSFCVYSPKTSPCPGDSGSPVVVKGQNGEHIQVGLVTGGNGPCVFNNQEEYAFQDVPHYRGWIKKTVQQ